MKVDSLIDSALESKVLSDKIYIGQLYAHLITGHSSKIYSALDFENKTIDYFYESNILSNAMLQPIKKSICHVLTIPYMQGGHTRLCEKLASMEDGDSNLLVSQSCSDDVFTRLIGFFGSIKICSKKDVIDRIVEIACHLSQFEKIILHIHPSDILTVVAVGLLKRLSVNLKVFFVNHADHVFSYGRSVADVMFLVSNRGYEVESEIGSVLYKKTFLGIPVNIPQKPQLDLVPKRILIAGSSYKMKPNGSISIQREINRYLSERPNCELVVVGTTYIDYWWWPIKILHWSRVKLYTSLQYEDYMAVLHNCNACIDTAPITGGTAFVEMYLNSLRPLAIHSGISGYTPLDKIRAVTLSDSEINGLTCLDVLYDSVVEVHSIQSVKKRYLDGLNGRYHDICLSLTESKNDLDLFICSAKADVPLSVIGNLLNVTSISFWGKLNLLLVNISIFHIVVRVIKFVHHRLNMYLNGFSKRDV